MTKVDCTDSAQGLRQLAASRWSGVGGLPYVYLVFLVYLFVEPVRRGATAVEWLVTLGSIAIFLPLYFAGFRHPSTRSHRAVLFNVAIAVLGFALIPTNPGATTYVIYAAAGAGYVLRPRQALAYLVLLSVALVGQLFLLGPQNAVWIGMPMVALIGAIGGTNVYQAERLRHQATLRLAQQDVEEMAKVAERERIARDLHDLLGHTLSVITLKSELASKLADSDPARAAVEIREVERISRETLSEVRRAVEGYRHHGFKGELHNAERALSAAGVGLDTAVAPLVLPPQQETVLALTLREAITNVVRHSGARTCRVRLEGDGRAITLTVEDDGRGGQVVEGSGLSGMLARVSGAGGDLRLDGSSGMRLTVTLPAVQATAGSLS